MQCSKAGGNAAGREGKEAGQCRPERKGRVGKAGQPGEGGAGQGRGGAGQGETGPKEPEPKPAGMSTFSCHFFSLLFPLPFFLLWLLIFVLDPINIAMIRTALRRPGTLSEVAMRLVLTKVPSTVLVLNHEGPVWLQYRNSRITRRYSSIGSLWFRVSSI